MEKKEYIRNVVLIMSAGRGTRFGADKPKQYCNMMGRPIIEYALDACRLSSATDEIVIVASPEYTNIVQKKYGFPTTVGGNTRTESLANGLAYISEHYACEKVIIANAVCPLMTESQIDQYFMLLDQYDYILTTWKVVSTLHRYDGRRVDRDEYFHVMEPEAYRFPILYSNYKGDFPVPYIFHQMPERSKAYFCFDYPYTMKVTYARDIDIAERLYNEIILKPKRDKTRQNINLWLSSFENKDIMEWLLKINNYMEELIERWEITSYTVNPQTFATCVYEAESKKYGSVIVKFHAPSGRFELELLYYQMQSSDIMAELLDYDSEFRVLLIQKIKPGIQVKFHSNDSELKRFYQKVSKSLLSKKMLDTNILIPTIISDFERNIHHADKYNFEQYFRKKMEEKVKEIWMEYFASSPQYYLHRDLHRRNLLRTKTGIMAIDPLGIIGPEEFEYTIPFIIEAKADMQDIIRKQEELLDFFSEFCNRKRLYAALFIMWVHKMDEYVFVKHDNFKLAKWTIECIKKFFYEKDEWKLDGKLGWPRGLK